MAFNKRTWKGRQGVGLNKFSINGASPVTVVNQPDSITEVGDALSAGNLNDLEDRIESAFTDEATEREADLTDVKNALDATNARVENLEQEHGSYQEVTAKSPYTIPSGKAKNWSVNVLRGVTRAENQLATRTLSELKYYNGSGTWNDNVYTLNGLSFTVNGDGSITVTGTASTTTAFWVTNNIQGGTNHSYFIAGCPSGGSTTSYMLGSNVMGKYDVGSGVIFTIGGTTHPFIIRIYGGYAISGYVTFMPVVRDLTLYFGGNIPSSAQTIADIQQNYPELLVPSDYGNSLLSTRYEGVKSISRNRLKPSTFKSNLVSWGGTDNGDGTVSIAASQISGKVVWENDTPTDQISIYLKGSNGSDYSNLRIFYTDGTYDAGVRIYSAGGWTLSNANKRVDRIQGEWTSGTTTFVIDSCGFFLGSVNTWSDYFESTLSLPTPITLKSAGSVAEEFDLESGEATSNVKQADITLANNDSFHYTNVWFFTFQKPTDYVGYNSYETPSAMKTRLTFPKYEIGRTNVDDASNIGKICGDILPSSFTIGFAPNTTLAQAQEAFNGKFNYALATPTTEQLDPIENPYLPTESGGTISSILTDAVDDSMTIGYINL